jgi:Raf kinase inhibitor-like YbhB/YbcL family protein
MDARLSRRHMVSTAALASGGLVLSSLGATRVAAQATPATGSTPAPVTSECPPRDPYAFLGDLPLLTLTSTDVADGEEMPAAQRGSSAGGQDVSPQLAWAGQPDGVQSYVVTMYDVDAPTPSGFWHWAVFNIPGDTTELPSGAGAPDSTLLPAGSVQMPNDLRMPQYIGAAPPPGPSHRYYIGVFALDVPTLDVAPDLTPAVLSFNTLGHILAYGTFVPVATSG